MDTQYFLNKLISKENLSTEESHDLLIEMMNGNINPVMISAILTALAVKGETSDEIIGFIQAMRKNMLKIEAKDAVDVCGTGGDRKNTFNISTVVAFVTAGAGVKVAKHGNRAASSKCGSADVLQELGVKIDLSPEQAESVLQKAGMVFLFAPLYHPAFKNVAIVRKELGVKTIFNFLGPFTSPAGVKRQIIGVPNIEIAEKLAEVGKKLDYEHLIIVSSEDGLDEVSINARTHVFEVKNKLVKKYIFNPKDLGLKKRILKELTGGSPKENAEIIKDILRGENGPKKEMVILNSAFALLVSGKTKNISEGIDLAQKSINKGFAKNVLINLIKETRKYA